VIGKIDTPFDTDNPSPFSATGGVPDRTRSLFGRFVRENLLEHLLRDKDAQQAFADWMEKHLDRGAASKKTKRNDLKDIRRFAGRNKMHWLETKMESLLLEPRNTVPNKRRTFALSHLISQDTISRLQDYFETQQFTVTQYQAIQLFLVTCMTGLRTIEWSTAKLVQPPCQILPGESKELPFLEVQTAKSRDEEPRIRRLILDEFSDAQIETLYQTLQYAQSISKGTRSNLVIQARRILQQIYMDNPEAIEVLAEADFRTARKIYTVELRRGGASMKETAAALGHTSITNVRYYSHGDISVDRTTKLPLARPPLGDIDKVKDTLAELNEARRQKGLGAIRGYEDTEGETPATRGRYGNPASGESKETNTVGQSLLDKL